MNSKSTILYSLLQNERLVLIDRYSQLSFDTIPLIEYCVDKTTIRSFHKSKGHVLKFKPLSIFRVWAYNYLNESDFLDQLKTRRGFKDLRKKTLNSLKRFWKNVDGGSPLFYQFNKLIDLFFKFLPCWKRIDKGTKNWLFKNVNVPLDKYSLTTLCEYSDINLQPPISMNSITNRNYNKIQKEIKKICRKIPAIVFDLYAWELNHKPKTNFELLPLKKIIKKV